MLRIFICALRWIRTYNQHTLNVSALPISVAGQCVTINLSQNVA